MTAPTSTAPAVKAAIVAGVQAALTAVSDTATLVCYDEPGPAQPDDIVSIGRVDREVTALSLVGSGGTGWLDEQYTIEVIVSSYRGGDDPQTVFERAASLADTVIEFVRSDPSIGGRVVVARPSHWTYEGTWEPEHKGRIATAVGHIYVTTRI